MLDSSYRYSRWDGTQDVFDMDAEELMDQLSGELLNHGDVWKALRDLMRKGAQDRQGERVPGLRDLLGPAQGPAPPAPPAVQHGLRRGRHQGTP